MGGEEPGKRGGARWEGRSLVGGKEPGERGGAWWEGRSQMCSS